MSNDIINIIFVFIGFIFSIIATFKAVKTKRRGAIIFSIFTSILIGFLVILILWALM